MINILDFVTSEQLHVLIWLLLILLTGLIVWMLRKLHVTIAEIQSVGEAVSKLLQHSTAKEVIAEVKKQDEQILNKP